MISILGQIKKASLNNSNTLFQEISKKIMDGFYKGTFFQEKELADMCFTCSSTVTKYAKSLNLSGYRELVIRLHYEYEKLNIINSNTNIPDDGMCIISNTTEWLKTNQDFLIKLKFAIKKHMEINIFSSYQAHTAAIYFKTILEELDVRVRIITGQDIVVNKERINKSPLNLILMCGQDTNELMNILTNFFKPEDKEIFLISTQGQYEKINFKLNEVMLIDIPFAESNKASRTMILTNLFYKIYFMTKL